MLSLVTVPTVIPAVGSFLSATVMLALSPWFVPSVSLAVTTSPRFRFPNVYPFAISV